MEWQHLPKISCIFRFRRNIFVCVCIMQTPEILTYTMHTTSAYVNACLHLSSGRRCDIHLEIYTLGAVERFLCLTVAQIKSVAFIWLF